MELVYWAGEGEDKAAAPEDWGRGRMAGILGKGSTAAGPGRSGTPVEGALSFRQGSVSRTPSTDEEMQTQRRRFTRPRSHSKDVDRACMGAAPSHCFHRSDGAPGPESGPSKYLLFERQVQDRNPGQSYGILCSFHHHLPRVLDKYLLSRLWSKGLTWESLSQRPLQQDLLLRTPSPCGCPFTHSFFHSFFLSLVPLTSVQRVPTLGQALEREYLDK